MPATSIRLRVVLLSAWPSLPFDKYSSPEYNLDRVQFVEKVLNSVRDAYRIKWKELS